MRQLFEGVYADDQGPFTINLIPGERVYGEKLVSEDGTEYRSWNPWRSKLASAIQCGLKQFPFKKDTKVLYLGSATGTTVSHVSDIVSKGVVYSVEFAPRSMRDFLSVARARHNIVPILGDAKMPLGYAPLIDGVDVIYQDVAQPEQAEILVRNMPLLKKGGVCMLCIKARSVDVTKDPEDIFKKEISVLKKAADITQVIDISDFEKDHSFVVGVKR